MSAIARYMLSQNVEVFGYDKTKTSLTKKLEAEGMKILYSDDPSLISDQMDIVVFTPAIPESNKILKWFHNQNIVVMKRSEVLGLLSQDRKTLAVAGTHGKTSTSSTAAHMLTHNNKNVSAFIGGIMTNYGSNYIEGSGDWIVVEADEYDRSFLTLAPDVAIVMSMDPDHLDIYGEHESMVGSFNEFLCGIVPHGNLVLKEDLMSMLKCETMDNLKEKNVNIITFGYEEADVLIRNIRIVDDRYEFDVEMKDRCICDLISNMPGRHNIENTTAAIIACLKVGVDDQGIREGLASFRGIKRRFEYVYQSEKITYIDDYAHHPTEINAAIRTAKNLFKGRKVTGIFQPHLYSRTRDFAKDFARELDELDEVLLLDIYPAREDPISGVNSEMIRDLMENRNVKMIAKELVIEELKNRKLDVLLTLGAGDIDVLVPQLKKWLEK